MLHFNSSGIWQVFYLMATNTEIRRLKQLVSEVRIKYRLKRFWLGGLGPCRRPGLREGGEAALVQADLDVAVPDPLQVDHRRGDVPMSHPLLEGADVDAVLQVSRGVRVPELVQEPTAAKWAVGATIDPHRTILKLVRDSAMAAIELAAPDDGLQLFQHGTVGLARSTRE